MRACLLAVAALFVAACTGCHGVNLARGNCDSCCSTAGACGCSQGCGNACGCGLGNKCKSCFAGGGACAGGNCGAGGFGGGAGGGGYHGPPHLGTRGTPGFPHGGHHRDREYVGPQGPPTAQVAYPYYTIRGPRDYFLDNPPSIGR